MREEFELIADDGQIKKMNEEYAKIGIATPCEEDAPTVSEVEEKHNGEEEKGIKNPDVSSALTRMPLPVYMQNDCYRYLELAESIGAVINNLDGRFVGEFKKELEFIYVKEDKNSIYVRALADIKQDVRAQYSPMPLRVALVTLLRLSLSQSVILDKILAYDKSESSKEIRLNQLALTGALNTLALVALG